MTCIAAVRSGGRVIMAGDSCGSYDGATDQNMYYNEKVFARPEGYVVGCTGPYRMTQLLQYSVNWPKKPDTGGALFSMVTKVIPEVIRCFKENGFNWVENERIAGGEFLVGVSGRLFVVCSDYAVLEPMDMFYSIGCGSPYAIGYMAGAIGSMSADSLVKSAVDTASRYSAGVGGKIVTVSA